MINSEEAATGPLRIDDVVIVVPVRDEQQLLQTCLDALLRCAERTPVPVRIQLVLDACTDRSARVAEAAGVDVIAVDAHNVGVARAAGFVAAGTGCGAQTWFCTTDADSRVDHYWLDRQIRYAQAGAEVVAGVVTVADWDEYTPQVRARYERGYRAGRVVGHVHGASLGFRADIYWRTGGFVPLSSGEDVEFVRRAADRGARVVWAEDVVVSTSGRRFGRAPGGFAAHLRRLESSRSPEAESA
ncbi:glycosyltransferase [Nocardia sp. NBC_01503]|uniref:glycosyltransferase n=1 Tax=Nocardia sp. NBC_01503 TaxID=2975997 RepID=UPI002E7B4C25|nr:glycosyltransferase [Nocardia sp. NBC_01503]WTL32106.1 glycosyltransferase [Nocardia sp. NBC_01503]